MKKLIKKLLAVFGLLNYFYKKKQDKTRYYVQKKYGLYNGLPTIDIKDLCYDLNVTIKHYTFLEGTSLPIDIALLKCLAKTIPNCKYLEIGTWRGESIINVAEVTKDCYSISLSALEMAEMGFSEGFIRLNRFFIKEVPNIKTINHNSLTFDFSKIDNDFNLIFIDGDHTQKGVKSDTTNAFKIRDKENGIIVWHDYGLTTERINWEVLAGILDRCPKNYINNLYHVSNTLCAIFILGDFKTYFTTFPTKPNKYYSIKIEQHLIKD